MDEDFLIVSGERHDGFHYHTQDGELGRVPEDLVRLEYHLPFHWFFLPFILFFLYFNLLLVA